MAIISRVSPSVNPTIVEGIQTSCSKIPPLKVERTFSEHKDGVTGLGILDGSKFMSGSIDRSIKTWDKSSEISLNTQSPDDQNRIWVMQLLTDKICVAIGWSPVDASNRAIRIYNTRDGSKHDLSGHQEMISSLAISKDGLLASGSYDWSVKIWEPFSSRLLHTYGSGKAVGGVGFLLDGKTVVCGNYHTGEIQFWEITNAKPDDRKPDKVFHSPAKINSLLVMQNGKVATGCADAVVRIWDPAETPENALKKELRGHYGHVPALAERPDHRLISGSSDRTMILWDTDTGESWVSPKEHTDEIHAVAAFDDNSVLTASFDGKVKLWTEVTQP